jgi:SAM-dependent methyltransferase
MAIEEVYLHPDDYDLELASRAVDDLPFWEALIRREAPRSVLEVGCGTGRLSIPLARLAARERFKLTGLEAERPMLARARQRLRAEPPTVREALQLVEGDVRTLALPGPFEMALLPYGVAHHLLDLDEQLAAWRALRRHLNAGGVLCVDLTAPDMAVLGTAVAGTRRHLDMDVSGDHGRRLRRSVASRYAPATQLLTHAYQYESVRQDGEQRRYRSDFAMHVYFPREIALLCRLTGFAIERLFGSYAGEPFDDRSRLLIVQARAVCDEKEESTVTHDATSDQQATTAGNTPHYNHLYAVFDATHEAEQACSALVAAGFAPRRLQPHASADAFKDPGSSSSPAARLERWVKRLGGETHDAERYADHLEHGRAVLAVAAPDRAAALRIADVITRHGGYDVTYYAPLAKEYMSPEANAAHGLPTFATTTADHQVR